MKNGCKFFKNGFVYASAFAAVAFVAGCTNDNVAGGASGDAGVVAVKDWEVAGVSQKGPFVTGSAVTVQELDGISLKQTGKSFKGTIKSDKGDFAIKDINLESQYAILEATGYYRDEVSGKKSSGTVTLRALTDLTNRKSVNINLLTHLEFERVKYLVAEKKMPIADAKAQAEKEILTSFAIDGEFAESEDLNIFESGDGNAALLAVSVLMQSDVDVAGLTERMGEFSISLAEGGSWDDADTKTAIADWACNVDLKGTIANVRKNVENWKYADTVPAFEKYVTNFWWNNYGLGVCNAKRESETKRNINKLSELYNEYFVCEKGRWRIPGDESVSSSSVASSSSKGKNEKSSSSEKESKSSSSGTSSSSEVSEPADGSTGSSTGSSSSNLASSSSSSSVPLSDVEMSSSSVASSSSAVNPFARVDRLPEQVAFINNCNLIRRGTMTMGDGKQNVWFYGSNSSLSRDSLAEVFVDSLFDHGFSYEGMVKNDSLDKSYADSSYVFLKKLDNVTYKIAITKYTFVSATGLLTMTYTFDVKIVELKDGFEELPSVDVTSLRYETELPEEVSFLNDVATYTHKSSWSDSALYSSWLVVQSIARVNLTAANRDDPPEEEKVKETADSLEIIKRLVVENGFEFERDTTMNGVRFDYYVRETDLAKYELRVFSDIGKKYDGVILGNELYEYLNEINVYIYYKKKPERNKP
jgi:hypothetical protein